MVFGQYGVQICHDAFSNGNLRGSHFTDGSV